MAGIARSFAESEEFDFDGVIPADTMGLARQARKGDRWAMEVLFERVRPRLERWIALRMGNHIRCRLDVEDLVQETLDQAWQGLPRFTPKGPKSFFSWLVTIAENRIRDARDRIFALKRDPTRERELNTSLHASWTSPSMNVSRREEHEKVLASLMALRESHREVIRLVRMEELSYEEAGQRLGITPKNVGVRLVRAVKAWREAYDRDRPQRTD